MEVDSWITITILVNAIALVFQIGAYAAPMWAWRQTSSTYTGIGLWYTVGCQEITCGNTDLTDALFDQHQFLAIRVLQSVGLVGVLALFVFLVVYKLGYSGKWPSMETFNLVGLVLCIFTILVLLASAAVFGAYYYNYFTFVNTYNKSSLPWSPMMSLLCALVLLIVCVLIRWKCRTKSFHGHVPMSGDTKLDWNPQVQNGMHSRYYNQTPYQDDRGRYLDDHRSVHSRPRAYEEIDDRRNFVHNSYDQRNYINRAYQQDHEPTFIHDKPASREFRENRDREIGHTVYTGNGFSYLKGEVSRYDRDRELDRDIRYVPARPVALVEYNSPRVGHSEEFFDHIRSSSRVPAGSPRGLPPSSNVYIYRPHHQY